MVFLWTLTVDSPLFLSRSTPALWYFTIEIRICHRYWTVLRWRGLNHIYLINSDLLMWIGSLLHIEFHMFCDGISSIYIIHAFLRQYYLKKKNIRYIFIVMQMISSCVYSWRQKIQTNKVKLHECLKVKCVNLKPEAQGAECSDLFLFW